MQEKIVVEERRVDELQGVPASMRRIKDDIADLDRRIGTSKAYIQEQKFDERVTEKLTKARLLEIKRDDLNAEMRSLSLQADSRAKLDVNRTSLRNKIKDVGAQ